MRLALHTTFRASRKEPLSEMLERIHAAFLSSGEGAPSLIFAMSDAPVPGFVSSLDRVRKRFPRMERFHFSAPLLPGTGEVRQLSKRPGTPGAGQTIEFAELASIAAGVPRSFPFHQLSIHLHSPAFAAQGYGAFGAASPGITIGDSWWVNGRNRSLTALTFVDADPASKKLPPPPESVAMILAACGKAKSTMQVPLGEAASEQPAPERTAPDPEAARAVAAVVRDYRTRLAEVVQRAALPHQLPPLIQPATPSLGATTGPKKPVIDRVFKPMGYECRGGTGTFTLTRRTAANLTVEIEMDVGTWSNRFTGSFRVFGLGFRALLPLPISSQPGPGQYPIGDAESWRQIVENAAALAVELDRSFVPDVEAVSGSTPEWYKH